MRQRLFVVVGRPRRGVPHGRRSRAVLAILALLVTGCASHSLMPKEQAEAIKSRDRALASQAPAIQAAIRQSQDAGALAFFDTQNGRLVVLPGETPADAWARHTAAPASDGGRMSVPAVVTFVHRADLPMAPEAVTVSALEQRQAVRTSVDALEQELREVREGHRRTEERLAGIQRELAESIAATKQETDRSLAGAKADLQRALTALGEELAAARAFMLQTAQLGWLNQELNVENANSIRRVATAGQELTATSARLAAMVQQLSETLAGQLKELATRLDAIQGKVGDIK
jgi:hypothetical protein